MKSWLAGLGMAWMNTALGFILPSTPGIASTTPESLCLQCVSALALAVAIRAIHPLLPGIDMFQSFIEWSIASRTAAALQSVPEVTNSQVVISTALLFCILHWLRRSSEHFHSFYQDSAATLEGIAAIMFTNSMISTTLMLLAPSNRNAGIVAVALVAGMVLSKAIIQIMLKLSPTHKFLQ